MTAPTVGPPPVPAWARPGAFRLSRWDGRPVEVAKAVLSGRHHMFDPDNLQACTDWYSDQSIELLERARINWVWVTWSVGFSAQAERHQQEMPAQ